MCILLGSWTINAFPSFRLLAQSFWQLLITQQKSFDFFISFISFWTSTNVFSDFLCFTKNQGRKMVDFVEKVIDQLKACRNISLWGYLLFLPLFSAVSIVTNTHIWSGFLWNRPEAKLCLNELIQTAGFRKMTPEKNGDQLVRFTHGILRAENLHLFSSFYFRTVNK